MTLNTSFYSYFFLVILLSLPLTTLSDCLCGVRDATPDKFGFVYSEEKLAKEASKIKKHQAQFGTQDHEPSAVMQQVNQKNLNSSKLNGSLVKNVNLRNKLLINSGLTDTYQVASIVNYIDIFISKFNRLNLMAEGWSKPMYISGVKRLGFEKENRKGDQSVFKTLIQHQMTENLFIEVVVELISLKSGKDQFNAFSYLVKRNVAKDVYNQIPEKSIWKKVPGKNLSIKTILKKTSLSYFFGNQLAVDVCRFMYISVNKVLTEYFKVDLGNAVYKEVHSDLRAKDGVAKKECIVLPSFKVYLGVGQIERIITQSRDLMNKFQAKNSNELLLKVKMANKVQEQKKKMLQNQDGLNELQDSKIKSKPKGMIDEGPQTLYEIPKLKRRNSALLTPIIMNVNDREQMATDYDGEIDYIQKINELSGVMDIQEYMNQDFDNTIQNRHKILEDQEMTLNLQNQKISKAQKNAPVKRIQIDLEPKMPPQNNVSTQELGKTFSFFLFY